RYRTVTGVQTCALPIFPPPIPPQLTAKREHIATGTAHGEKRASWILITWPFVHPGACLAKEMAQPFLEATSVNQELGLFADGGRSEERRVGEGGRMAGM